LRTFKAEQSDTWGTYKWNFDGKYLASFGNDMLNIYELPSMLKITDETGKRTSIKLPNIRSIEWSPTKN